MAPKFRFPPKFEFGLELSELLLLFGEVLEALRLGVGSEIEEEEEVGEMGGGVVGVGEVEEGAEEVAAADLTFSYNLCRSGPD